MFVVIKDISWKEILKCIGRELPETVEEFALAFKEDVHEEDMYQELYI